MERDILFREIVNMGYDREGILDTILSPVKSVISIVFGTKEFVQNKIVQIAFEEWESWDKGNLTEDKDRALSLLKKYWKEGNNLNDNKALEAAKNSQKGLNDPGRYWSSAFVCFIMKKVYPPFPGVAAHLEYYKWAKKNREQGLGTNFYAFKPNEVEIEVGDIILNLRDGGSHGDIVVKIEDNIATVIGGNVGNANSGNIGVTVNIKKRKIASNGKLANPGQFYSVIKLFSPAPNFTSTPAKSNISYGTNNRFKFTKGKLLVSKKSLDLIISSEISNEKEYNQKYKFPTVPGGASGVTIGIGYDLGQGVESIQEFQSDWQGLIDDRIIQRLTIAIHADHKRALSILSSIRDIEIPFESAKTVFYKKTLGKYASKVIRVYPSVEFLYPDAQGAILSLVFNRGTSVSGDRRLEMRNLINQISSKDYSGIARSIRSMKRLWINKKNLRGVVIRRENEARLVENSNRTYSENELISLS